MKSLIEQEVFNKEIKMCKELYNKGNVCAWGKCDQCGVIPLLHKLFKGEVLEEKQQIIELKSCYLK